MTPMPRIKPADERRYFTRQRAHRLAENHSRPMFSAGFNTFKIAKRLTELHRVSVTEAMVANALAGEGR